MPAKQIISILTLSTLITLPVGIAKAGSVVEVNGNRSEVIIKNGNRPRRKIYVYPRPPKSRSYRRRYYRYPYRLRRLRRSRYPYSRLRDSRWRRYRNRIRRNTKCNGVGRTYNRTITSRSRNGSTYSSVYTSNCQR